jgi:lipopolysaccharide biosynthesis glycosyltransferase
MNFIEMLLVEKLKSKNPMLDILGSDRKILQIACQDLTNYLKVHWNLMGTEASEYELTNKLEEFYQRERKELEDFIDLWTGIWLKKWSERVKLLIGNESSKKWNKITRIINNAEPIWRKLPNRKEMQEVVISTLIKNGEICGTAVLSENLLKMELGENLRKYANSREQTLNVVSNTLRKARELSKSKGPLIFVKIDKSYYNNDNL